MWYASAHTSAHASQVTTPYAARSPVHGSTPRAAGVVEPTRVHVDDAAATERLAAGILAHAVAYGPGMKEIALVCIGSDRSTGDALGPLVGTRLKRSLKDPRVEVRGSLEEPVHAANLAEHLDHIEGSGRRRLVVAVDACLGRSENVGTACVKAGPLKPGTGVNKNLPSVGAFHIVGVVNVGGFMEYFVLQNTRLNLVIRLADMIADALKMAVERYLRTPSQHHVAAAFEP